MMATGRKEGNVLFNDALNTFYLRLYGINDGNSYRDIKSNNRTALTLYLQRRKNLTSCGQNPRVRDMTVVDMSIHVVACDHCQPSRQTGCVVHRLG